MVSKEQAKKLLENAGVDTNALNVDPNAPVFNVGKGLPAPGITLPDGSVFGAAPTPTAVDPRVTEARIREATDFIRAREKAESKGALKRDAFNIAVEQTAGQSGKTVTTKEARAQAQSRLEAAQSLGQLTPEQLNLDVVKGAGAAGAIQTLGAGATGALTGAGVGFGIAGPPGAIAVGTAGFVVGAFSKITTQKRQNVKEATTVFQQATSNMAWIINEANSGRMSYYQASQMWNEELANFYSAERNLKQETSNSFKRLTSGGTDELRRVEAFKRTLPFLQAELSNALQNPDPTKVIAFDPTLIQ